MSRITRRAFTAGAMATAFAPSARAVQFDADEEPEVVVQQLAETTNVPGIVLQASNGFREISVASGFSKVETGESISAETQMHVASLVKPFTGLVLRGLLADHGISVDTPVQSIIPEFEVADAVASSEITIDHLMTHTSGLVSATSLANVDVETTVESYVANLGGWEQIAAPGGPFGYQNVHAIIAARLIEVLSRSTYTTVMQGQVFEPLQVQHAAWQAGAGAMTPHINGVPGDPAGEVWPLAGLAAGGLWITSADLQVMARHLLETMEFANQVPGGSMSNIIADELGSFLFRTGELYWHSGRTPGSFSLMVLHPGSGWTFTVLTNDYTGHLVAIPLVRWLLNSMLDNHDLDLLEPTAVQPDVLPGYFGSYSAPDAETLRVETAFVSDGPPKIAVFAGERDRPAFLDWLREDVFFDEQNRVRTLIDFVRDDTGAVGWVRNGGKLLRKLP